MTDKSPPSAVTGPVSGYRATHLDHGLGWQSRSCPELQVDVLGAVPHPGQARLEPLRVHRRLRANPVLGGNPCLLPLRPLLLPCEGLEFAAHLVLGDHAGLEAKQDLGQGPAVLDEFEAFACADVGVREFGKAGAEALIEPPDHRSKVTGDLLKFADYK